MNFPLWMTIALAACLQLAASGSPSLRLSAGNALSHGASLLEFPVHLNVQPGEGPEWVLKNSGEEWDRGKSMEEAQAALRRRGLQPWPQGGGGGPKAFAAWNRLYTVEHNIMGVLAARHGAALVKMARLPVVDHGVFLEHNPLTLPPAWVAKADTEASSALEHYLQDGYPCGPMLADTVAGGFVQGHILGAGLEAILPGMASVWRKHALELEAAVVQCPQNPSLWRHWYRASRVDSRSVQRLLAALPRPEAEAPFTWPPLDVEGLGCLVDAARRARAWRPLAEYLEGLAEVHRRAPGVFQGRAPQGRQDNPFARFEPGGDAAWEWVGGPRLEALLHLGNPSAATELVSEWASVAPGWVARAAALAKERGHRVLAQAWLTLPLGTEQPVRAPAMSTAPLQLRPSLWVLDGRMNPALEAWAKRVGLPLRPVPASRLEALARPGEQWVALDLFGKRVQGSTEPPTVQEWDSLLGANPGLALRAQASRHRKTTGDALWTLQADLALGEVCEPGREALAEAYLARRGWLLARASAFPWIPPRGKATAAFEAMALRALPIVEQALLDDPSNGRSWELWAALAGHAPQADPSRLLREVGLGSPTDPLALEILAEWAQTPEQASQILPAARNAWDARLRELRARQSQTRSLSFDGRATALPLIRLRLLLDEPEAALDVVKAWLELGGDPHLLRSVQAMATAFKAVPLQEALQPLVPPPAPPGVGSRVHPGRPQ